MILCRHAPWVHSVIASHTNHIQRFLYLHGKSIPNHGRYVVVDVFPWLSQLNTYLLNDEAK